MKSHSAINSLFKRILFRLVRIVITIVITQRPNRIVFVQESNSGSNSYALHKLAGQQRHAKYDLILLKGIPLNAPLIDFIKWYRIIASSKIIFTTHASIKPSKRHKPFQICTIFFMTKKWV